MAIFEIKDSSYLAEYERGVISLLRYNPMSFSLFQEDELVDSYEVTWYEEPWSVDAGAVGAGGWTDSAAEDLVVTDAFAEIVKKNHVLEIEGEQVRVLSVDSSANTISVYERGFGGTVAAAHAAEVVINIIGKAEEESVITSTYAPLARMERSNFVQEFTEDIIVSARSAKQRMKDVDDLLQDEQQAKMRKMLKYLNRTALLGRRNNDTVNGVMTTGGIRHAIEGAGGVVVECATPGTLIESDLQGVLESLAERGSQADTLIMNPVMKGKMVGLAGFTADNIVVGSEARLGGYVSGYVSDALDGRVLNIVVDPELVEDAIYVVDSQNLRYHAVANEDGGASFMKLSDEPTTSATRQQTLRSEVVFVVKQADLMGILTLGEVG